MTAARHRVHSAAIRFIALLICAWMLASCASSREAEQYTLRQSDAPVAESTQTLDVGQIVRVRRAVVPAEIDRPQLVWSTAGHRVLVDEFHRWPTPLGEEISTAVAAALQQTIPCGWAVTVDDASSRDAEARVDLDVQQFDLWPNGATALEIVWTITVPSMHQSISGRSRMSDRHEGAGIDAVIAAQASAVSAVGREIASSLASLGGSSRCG
jgi:uncharacterized lipoprotein YmbA